jgi:lipoprotein-releasing system permease protein
MGYPLVLALRYLRSKKRAMVSVGTAFAILGLTLGVAALAIVMSVTGGFQAQFREKVLGVNAHVILLKYSTDFPEYRDVMAKVRGVKGVTGAAPFLINAVMVTHGARTATGVQLKGVDPALMGEVLDLPKYLVSGSLAELRRPGAVPPARPHTAAALRDPFEELVDGGGGSGMGAGSGSDGGARSFFDAIQRELADEDTLRDAGSAVPAPPESPVAPPAGRGPHPPRTLAGDVTPSGGYASQLPADDALPEALDPDVCKNPSAASALSGVAIGKTLATQLGVHLGDCVQLTSPTIGISYGASGTRPSIAKQFRVVALFEAGFDQYDSKFVFTDLYEAQAFYGEGDNVMGVEMKVDDIEKAHAIAKDIDRLLSNAVYRTMDWHELNRGLFTALLIQQIAMSCVLALIIVVAAFTVIATLIMVVLEKKKEIALLKAIGAKNGAILRVFLYQGAFIGSIGTVSGLIVGYLGCRALQAYEFPLDAQVYFIEKLPVEIRPREFIITGVFAVIICVLATVFPSLYAARLRPTDGLRAE